MAGEKPTRILPLTAGEPKTGNEILGLLAVGEVLWPLGSSDLALRMLSGSSRLSEYRKGGILEAGILSGMLNTSVLNRCLAVCRS